jgi:hypothetical protein
MMVKVFVCAVTSTKLVSPPFPPPKGTYILKDRKPSAWFWFCSQFAEKAARMADGQGEKPQKRALEDFTTIRFDVLNVLACLWIYWRLFKKGLRVRMPLSPFLPMPAVFGRWDGWVASSPIADFPVSWCQNIPQSDGNPQPKATKQPANSRRQ